MIKEERKVFFWLDRLGSGGRVGPITNKYQKTEDSFFMSFFFLKESKQHPETEIFMVSGLTAKLTSSIISQLVSRVINELLSSSNVKCLS